MDQLLADLKIPYHSDELGDKYPLKSGLCSRRSISVSLTQVSMHEDDLTPGMRRAMDVLCCTVLLAFAIFAIRIVGGIIVDAGGWRIVRKLNQDSGDLAAAAVAACALAFAYREYKIRNSPVFYLKQELRWMGDEEVVIAYSVKSEFERPIVLKNMRFMPESDRGVELKFTGSDFVLLPQQEIGIAVFALKKHELEVGPVVIEGFLTAVSSADASLYSSLRLRSLIWLDGKIPSARLEEYSFLPRVDHEA